LSVLVRSLVLSAVSGEKHLSGAGWVSLYFFFFLHFSLLAERGHFVGYPFPFSFFIFYPSLPSLLSCSFFLRVDTLRVLPSLRVSPYLAFPPSLRPQSLTRSSGLMKPFPLTTPPKVSFQCTAPVRPPFPVPDPFFTWPPIFFSVSWMLHFPPQKRFAVGEGWGGCFFCVPYSSPYFFSENSDF